MDDKQANREALTQMVDVVSVDIARSGYAAKAAHATANEKWEQQAKDEVLRLQKIKDFYVEELAKLN